MRVFRGINPYTRKWQRLLKQNRKITTPKRKKLSVTLGLTNLETGEMQQVPFVEHIQDPPKQKDFFRVKWYGDDAIADVISRGSTLRVFLKLRAHVKEQNRVYATKRGLEKALDLSKMAVHLAFRELSERKILRPDPHAPNWWLFDPNVAWVGYDADFGKVYQEWMDLLNGDAPLAVKPTLSESRLRRIQ